MSDYTSTFHGAYLEVSSLAARDAIEPSKRSQNMIVLVLGDSTSDPLPRRTQSKAFQLIGGIDNVNWVEYRVPPIHTAVQ